MEEEVNNNKWAKFKKFMTAFPKWAGLYFGLAGLVTFNCFILEEAFQTVMFGSWGAFDAKEYRLLKREIQTMEGLRTSLNVINNIGGWINPFGWVAYNGYVRAEREYIDALRAKLFAHAPEVFDGEVVTFTFTPLEEEPGENGMNRYKNGRITVLSPRISPVVTGKIKVKRGEVVVQEMPQQGR
jgi:hypothetical protein